jgi:hypothetical protein
MTDLSAILLGCSEALDVRPKGIIHHLKNFRIDRIQQRIIKLQRRNHALSIIGLERDALLFCFIQVLEEPIVEPPTRIQGFS